MVGGAVVVVVVGAGEYNSASLATIRSDPEEPATTIELPATATALKASAWSATKSNDLIPPVPKLVSSSSA